MDLGGDAMDHDTDTSILTRLKEEARLRHRNAADSRGANGAMSLKIKMIVSNWYTDELGNQARIIKARD
jgi:hypothetical protein